MKAFILAGAVALVAQSGALAAPSQPPMRHGGYVWNWEAPTEGRARIVIHLASEQLVVYRGNVEVGRSTIVFGADEKPTPTGSYRILQKKVDHVSNLYDAEMPFMLRLTNDGIAIHASNLRKVDMTHGCVGVPPRFARMLFDEVKLGDRVTITRT